jgi:hypothetical protein
MNTMNRLGPSTCSTITVSRSSSSVKARHAVSVMTVIQAAIATVRQMLAMPIPTRIATRGRN